LILGETKAGKTTLLATAAEYLWEEFGKILFLYTSELGGFSARVEQRIRQGIIRPFRMRTRDDAEGSLSFETMHLSSKGYVPVRFLNAQEGEVEPGVPMIGPTTTVYTQFCGKCGGEVQRTRYKSKLKAATCPNQKCKAPVTLQTGKVVTEVKQTAGFELIGSLGYDGLTSFPDWYLQDMSHRKNLGGEMAALGGEIESGGTTFRGNNRSQVGMAQTRVHELVANSLSIPNLVVMPFWTAISHESSDDTGRLTVVGPKLAGDAKTYIASSWFGNVTEAAVVSEKAGEYVRRLWVSQFYDGNNRRHLCGHRGDPRFMPTYFEDAAYTDDEPPTDICTGFSIHFFLKQLEESIQKGIDSDKFVGPGLASIPATYGDQGDRPLDEEAPAAEAPRTSGPTVRKPRTPKMAGGKAPEAPPATSGVPAPETPATAAEEPSAGTASPAEPSEPPAETAAGTHQEDVEAEEAAGEVETEVDQLVETTGLTDAEAEAKTAAVRPPKPPAAPPSATSQAAPPAPPVQAAAGWGRPAGSRPPPPRAPQSGPKAPARTPARPVSAVKPQ